VGIDQSDSAAASEHITAPDTRVAAAHLPEPELALSQSLKDAASEPLELSHGAETSQAPKPRTIAPIEESPQVSPLVARYDREKLYEGKPAAPEVELIDPRIASRPDRPISRQEPGIPGSDANGSHSADLKSPESTKVEADPGTVDGVQKPLVSASLMARYNREELYEKVWTTPVRILAREYGVSDVAIAKACRKLHIPLPGRGYWNKMAAHWPVEPRPPLPVIKIRSQQRTGTSRAPKPTTRPVFEEPPQV
jgi:hypothetical protein